MLKKFVKMITKRGSNNSGDEEDTSRSNSPRPKKDQKIIFKVTEGATENLRETIAVPKYDAIKEINSLKGSYGNKLQYRDSKNNFPFLIKKLSELRSMGDKIDKSFYANKYVNYDSLLFLRPRREDDETVKYTAINSLQPAAKRRLESSSIQFYKNKGKLGFELLIYSGNVQFNCYFSKFTRKMLLSSKNSGTYTVNGRANNPTRIPMAELARKLNLLIDNKFRFRIINQKNGVSRNNEFILTFIIRKYKSYVLIDEDGKKSDFFFKLMEDKSRFTLFVCLPNLRKLVNYQVASDNFSYTFVIYDILEDKIIPRNLFKTSHCFVNKEVTEDIELLTLDFAQEMRFYQITEEGGFELVYIYQKKRVKSRAINLRSESIVVIRRGNIITISEAEPVLVFQEGHFQPTVAQTNYHIEKFEL